MNKQELLAFLRLSYSNAALEHEAETEIAFAVIEDLTNQLGWKMMRSEGGFLKKASISIITDIGMRVITHKNGTTTFKSKGFDSFLERAYSALFIKYNGLDKPLITANFPSKSQDEVFIKDMANLFLAIGYDIHDLSTDKKLHKIHIREVAIANGLEEEKLDTSYTATDFLDWVAKYGATVLGVSVASGLLILQLW
jgi:hypothetical protein